MKTILFPLLFFCIPWFASYPSTTWGKDQGLASTTRYPDNTQVNVEFTPHIHAGLSLDGYGIWIDVMPGVPPEQKQTHMRASFCLINRSGVDVNFELISHCGEKQPIQFVLRDGGDRVLWQYIPVNPYIMCPDYIEPAVLPNNTTFRYPIRVPLVIDGTLLTPGDYVLEAFVDGYPQYGARSPFRVDYVH